MKQVLIPHFIAEKCTLLEAIYWIAFHKYPVAYMTENAIDQREDAEYQEEYELSVPDILETFFTQNLCWKYGLPKNAHAEYFSNHGELVPLPINREVLQLIEQSCNISDEEKVQQMLEFEELKAIEIEQQAFDEQLLEFFENHKLELVIQLRKGAVLAQGRSLRNLEFQDIDKLPHHTSIPSNLWKFQSINWEDSAFKHNKEEFIHILIDVESLFQSFPEPTPETAIVMQVNGILLCDTDALNLDTKKSVGRPSFNWKQFTQEMVKRMNLGQLPLLQKTCVYDMQEWCIQQWGKAPSETNLKNHISPFYGAIKSQKQKTKITD
jgi:hypothetical protein